MTEPHYLYTLTFDAEPQPVVFYVGHTNNPKRRETEHRASVKDLSNTEYKYQWCRELEAVGIKWDFVVLGEIEKSDDAEYEWVLKFARDNQSRDIKFIDNLPLTNMKRGDFLEEILADKSISTREQIAAYRQQRKTRVTSYDAESGEMASYGVEILRELQDSADIKRIEAHERRLKEIEREIKHAEMLASPERADRIKLQNQRLEAELRAGCIKNTLKLVHARNTNQFPKDQPDKLVKRK
jgi:predicted GIY-YIG superfamily endonuclease